jgi:signal transduction histidine kinase/CheY-like chemotaxis protein/putative methionine-R-sulfoxide reductase with GAF domain
MHTTFTSIQQLVEAINQAPTPILAAEMTLDWLLNRVGTCAVGLLPIDDTALHIVVNERNLPDPMILAWLRSDASWHTLTEAGEAQNGGALVVPLRQNGQMYGVLWQSFSDDASKAANADRVSLAAGMLTTRIHHLQTLHGPQELTEVVETLARQTVSLSVATSVSSVIIDAHQNLQAMLNDVTELICFRFGYASVAVYLLSPDEHDYLELAAIFTDSGQTEITEAVTYAVDDPGIVTWVLRNREAVMVNDVTRHPLYQGSPHLGDAAAQMVVPLSLGEAPLGVLAISSTQPDAFTSQDVHIIQSIADQLAVGIKNARLFEEVDARANDLSALTEIGLLVNSTLDIDDLAERVYAAFERLQSPDMFEFVIFDRFGDLLDVTTFKGGHITHKRRPYQPRTHLISQIIDQTTPVFWRNVTDREAARPYFLVEQADYDSFLGVPMLTKDHVVGVLCSYSMRAGAFNESALQVMLTFASSVAVAIENADLFSYTARRVQELAVINEISHVLALSFGDDNFWKLIHRQVASLFEDSALFVGLWDASTDRLHFPLASDTHMEVLPFAPIPLGGLCEYVIQNGKMLKCDDLKAEPRSLLLPPVKPMPGEPGAEARSWLGVPLQNIGASVRGLVLIYSERPGSYDGQDSTLLLTVAAQLSLSLENARLLKSEQERRQVANTLIDVGRVVASTLELDPVLNRILEQMQRVVQFDGASIQLQVPGYADGSQMQMRARRGRVGIRVGSIIHYQSPQHPVRRVCQEQRTLIMSDVRQFSPWENIRVVGEFTPFPIRSWMGAPMLVQNRLVGIITLDRFETDFYTDEDAATVYALARQAAVAVENAQLHEQQKVALNTLEMRANRLAALHRVASTVSSNLDHNQVMVDTANQLEDLFEAGGCFIALLVPNTDPTLEIAYPLLTAPPDGTAIAVTHSPLFDALSQQRRIITIDAEGTADPIRQVLGRTKMPSALVAPLIASDGIIGVIGLEIGNRETPFDEEEQQTYAVIASQVAVAIYNARLYEEALVANRLKAEFLAKISHELRTPLNAIIGYTDMLLTDVYGTLNEKQADRVSRVNRSGNNLLALIKDVLDLSRIDAGQLELERVPLSVNKLIQETLVDITPQVEQKGLSLDFIVSPNLPPIQADPFRLRQVLTNLLSNAVKFTDEGYVSITARPVAVAGGRSPDLPVPSYVKVPDGAYLALQVEDSGTGISEDNQRFIFDAFRQVDGSAAKVHEGTGLGLAIASQIMELHDGFIWVESQLGAGSTFTLLLPAAGPYTSQDVFEIDTGGDRPVILVIDDDTTSLQLVLDYLSDADYRVICTNRPARGLKLVRDNQPAAVVLDVVMPELDGLALLETLKGQADTAHIPVVMLTITEDRQQAIQRGADRFLLKPISQEALLAAINALAAN